MLLSIIIPVYNVEKYLKQCLDSIVGQLTDDVEVICVNDGSQDNSAAILETYCGAVTIVNQPNGGLSAARNTGMKHAHGEYVVFLDSDDWMSADAVSTLVRELSNRDLDVLSFASQNFDDEKREFETPEVLEPAEYQTGLDYYNKYALSNRKVPFVCVWQRAYRLSFLLEHELWFGEGLLHEDNLFTPLVLGKAKKVREINDVLYIYRHREGSITRTVGEKNVLDLAKIANIVSAEVLKNGYGKIAKQAVTCYYQNAFLQSLGFFELRQKVRAIVDWSLYFQVSLTKPRHVINFLKNRICH